jgi:hypothetical protein
MNQTPMDRLLGTDERDPGCDAAFELMDQYCEAVRRGEEAARLFPGVATHIHNCTTCREDTEALLAALEAIEEPGTEAGR